MNSSGDLFLVSSPLLDTENHYEERHTFLGHLGMRRHRML